MTISMTMVSRVVNWQLCNDKHGQDACIIMRKIGGEGGI